MKRNTQLAELKTQVKHNTQSDCSGRFGGKENGGESDYKELAHH